MTPSNSALDFRTLGMASTLRAMVIIHFLMGCSAGASRTSPGSNNFTPPANSIVGFSRSLITRQAQFTAYVSKAERLTILDPATLTEIWGTQVGGGFIDAVPLANFDGIALAGREEVRVYSDGAFRSFALGSFAENTSWSVAKDTATMIFANSDGKSARMIKHTGNADWMEKSFDIATESDTKVVGTLLSDSGDISMTIASPPGHYELYRNPYSESLSCRFTMDQWPEETTFRTGYLDEKNNIGLLAADSGKLYVIDIGPTASCLDPQTSGVTTFPARINYISQLKDGSYAAALNNGTLSLFSVTGTTTTITAEIVTSCAAAIGVLEGKAPEGSSGLLIAHCPGETQAFSLPDKQLLKRIQVSSTHALTPAFDADSNKVYFLDNGGLGTAHSINLITGETVTRKGLFVRKLFSSQ